VDEVWPGGALREVHTAGLLLRVVTARRQAVHVEDVALDGIELIAGGLDRRTLSGAAPQQGERDENCIVDRPTAGPQGEAHRDLRPGLATDYSPLAALTSIDCTPPLLNFLPDTSIFSPANPLAVS